MVEMKRYFGYKHWTLEEPPRCFNVGKGVRNRPSSHLNRNHKWHAIVKRYGLRVEVCIGPVTNEEACVWEVEQIAAMGTFSIDHAHDSSDIGCNLTRGGTGGTHPNLVSAVKNRWAKSRQQSNVMLNSEGVVSSSVPHKESSDHSCNVGTSNPAAKLTEDDVRNIRYLLSIGVYMKDVARRYGVHGNTIKSIKTGRTWSHVS